MFEAVGTTERTRPDRNLMGAATLRRFKGRTAVRLRNTRKAKLTTQRPREGNRLDIVSFSGHRHNGFASRRAVRIPAGAAAVLGGGRSRIQISMTKANPPTPRSRLMNQAAGSWPFQQTYRPFDPLYRTHAGSQGGGPRGQALYIAHVSPATPGQLSAPSARFVPGGSLCPGGKGRGRDKQTARWQRSVQGVPGIQGGFGKGAVSETPPFAEPLRAGHIGRWGGFNE